jgi:NAD(P)-dependent dehydrogenase (short-subunit alcohol dehydrogenase family)
MKDLAGRTAFISGGAGGIGRALAETFLDAGMNVVLADLDAGSLETARRSLPAPQRARTVVLDVTDRAAWRQAAAEAEQWFGRVHVLCNNAGVGGVDEKLGDMPPEDFDTLVAINLTGTFNGIRTFVNRILAHGEGGHIVNTSSMAGLMPSPASGAYSATKYAVIGLSEALRNELEPRGIGVSVLCPGKVDTGIGLRWRSVRPSAKDGGAQPPRPLSPNRGMRPRSVGRRVIEAIRDDEFYIVTHPEFRPVVAARHAEILDAFGASAEPGYSDDISYIGGPVLARARAARAGEPAPEK